MKKQGKCINLLLAAMLLTGALSCSDDEDKYNSVVPEFSDMTFKSLDAPSDESLYVGEKFVATAVQSRLGKLLDRTEYSWTCEVNDEETDITHRFKDNVVYDAQMQNPTDTVTVSQPGNYRMKFTAKYRVSGSGAGGGSVVAIPGGQITYNLSTLTYQVTIEKNFRVKAR